MLLYCCCCYCYCIDVVVACVVVIVLMLLLLVLLLLYWCCWCCCYCIDVAGAGALVIVLMLLVLLLLYWCCWCCCCCKAAVVAGAVVVVLLLFLLLLLLLLSPFHQRMRHAGVSKKNTRFRNFTSDSRTHIVQWNVGTVQCTQSLNAQCREIVHIISFNRSVVLWFCAKYTEQYRYRTKCTDAMHMCDRLGF